MGDLVYSIFYEIRELYLIFCLIFINFEASTDTQDVGQRFQIMVVDRQEDSLPTTQTCFFQLRLGPYSSKAAMAKKLHYAMIYCVSIDADNYMLARQNQPINNGGLFF